MLLQTAIAILGTLAGLIERQTGRTGFDPLKLRVGVALMLMLACGASVGGLLTPVGSPPNLIGRGLIEEAPARRSRSPSGCCRRCPSARRGSRRCA
jgi:solute carrier family 13 (sodium-dependent dicarboxylate transporter), member 2/3/5